MSKLNLAALNIALVQSEARRPITNPAVKRPVRDIRKTMRESLETPMLQAILSTVLASYGQRVEANNATWLFDHDDCARVIRTAYNTHIASNGHKMDSDGARNLWTQVYQQAHGEDSDVTFNEAATDAEAERD